ncbi:hypothetical protein N1F89_05690 [Aquibium sp. A9E412]|uniref:hypothetical protein n=1 Tax=Aquibium sp. A9E412 TaxID=2976767 RepID=UPI0025AF442A|nr:hypothetical protein [Aquibium sp. A9E412]MDN2565707.1 hypothetical protein [Aquibium sp. A9E412]
MTAIRPTAARAATALLAALLAAGCTATGNDAAPQTADPQPREATYRCEEEGDLAIVNRRAAVDVVSPRGVEVTLPAAPAGQHSRYGAPPYALVLEGRDALWMATGKTPISCRR